MRLSAIRFACAALLSYYARAQTVTTTDISGHSVVEIITVNPVNGVLTTQTIQTLTPTTTTPDVQAGPVGQPATNTGTGLTIYTYTTTDVDGATTAIVATFIPTFPASQSPSAPSSGTILNYSQYLSIYGTNTSTALPQLSTSQRLADALKPLAVGALAVLCGGILVFA